MTPATEDRTPREGQRRAAQGDRRGKAKELKPVIKEQRLSAVDRRRLKDRRGK